MPKDVYFHINIPLYMNLRLTNNNKKTSTHINQMNSNTLISTPKSNQIFIKKIDKLLLY